jgi:hypothetical protein
VAIATPHSTGLWIVPTNDTKVSTKPTCKFTDHVAHNVYQSSSKSKLIQFLHQCAFSPPPSTWIKPSTMILTADAVRKYLPDSTATAKGHLKKTPAGVRSTQPKQPRIEILIPQGMVVPANAKIKLIPVNDNQDLFPAKELNKLSHVFCWAALADQINSTAYTDLTGWFPTISLENNQYVFVAYDYTTNAILVRPIKD